MDEENKLNLGSVIKRITEAKNKRLNYGCDRGGPFMYYDEEGEYIKIEDVIELINTID